LILHRIPATSPLYGLVDVFWYFDTSSSSAATSGQERVLPTGTFEFVFNLTGDQTQVYASSDPELPIKLSGAMMCGVHSRYFLLDAERNGRVVGAHFKPGGAYPFLRDSAATFLNRHVDLCFAIGPAADTMRQELAALSGAEAVFDHLETFLVSKINSQKRHVPAVATVLAELEANPFTDRTTRLEIGMTRKALIEAFKRQVGLTPKKFARVLRFQQVLNEVAPAASINWADIAQRCGYYDQAHFGRDFKEFSGFSPRGYLARLGRNPNHVPAA
jgi:AraC-like DNA-binding protein